MRRTGLLGSQIDEVRFWLTGRLANPNLKHMHLVHGQPIKVGPDLRREGWGEVIRPNLRYQEHAPALL
ncbi:hypothetical protein ACVWZX_003704 [Deinococcus sp. UYEF24]